MADSGEKKKKSPIWLLVKLVIIVVVGWFGYKYGIGPLISAQKGEPSIVYVLNATDKAYDTSFGWRRISRVLHPNSVVKFQLYVGSKEKQTLTLTPQGGGTPRKLPIELWPNCKLLLNLDKASPLYAYHPENTAQAQLAVGTINGDLLARRQPASAGILLQQAVQAGRKATVGAVKNEIIDLAKYRPWFLLIDDFQDRPPAGELPLLTSETLTFSVHNGTFTWNPAKPTAVKLDTKLDSPVTVPMTSRISATLAAGSPVHLQTTADTAQLQIRGTKASECLLEAVNWSGTWSFEAHAKGTIRLDEASSSVSIPSMAWAWMYGGSATIKGSDWSISAAFPSQGSPKISKEKMEEMP